MSLILVVDDEPAIRDILTRWLKSAGHEVIDAGTADDALVVMRAQPAAVAFCDIQMPGHDGIWLTRQLRNQFPHVAVVLATGVTSVPPSVSMQAGVLAYLVKPLSRDAVINALATALQWHDDSIVHGAKAEDSGAPLDRWLDLLDG